MGLFAVYIANTSVFLYHKAPGDYTSFSANVTFTSGGDSTVCVNVSVFLDQTIENEEDFLVAITSSDPGASIGQDTSVVVILDSSGTFILIHIVYSFEEFGRKKINDFFK